MRSGMTITGIKKNTFPLARIPTVGQIATGTRRPTLVEALLLATISPLWRVDVFVVKRSTREASKPADIHR